MNGHFQGLMRYQRKSPKVQVVLLKWNVTECKADRILFMGASERTLTVSQGLAGVKMASPDSLNVSQTISRLGPTVSYGFTMGVA